jgi:hypothetical protein
MKKITVLIAIIMTLALIRFVSGNPPGYSFTTIAVLDNPAPGGGNFTFDFEPTAINNQGELAFTADLTDMSGTTDVGEGVFVGLRGQLIQVLRLGQPAPGTNPATTFGPAELLRLGLNDPGDLAIAFTLEPFDFMQVPFTLPSGIFRFSHSNQTLSAVALPGTPLPGGGVLKGVEYNTGINNRGDIVFSGIVTGADINPGPLPGCNGLGDGVFLGDVNGTISSVVRPGDAAPGGGTFDMAINASINNGGDIAFGGHVVGDECIDIGDCRCGESIYLKNAATGRIQSVVHQGDPAPGGGIFRLAFGAVVNSRGDIVFIGDLTPAPSFGNSLGVFLFTKGSTIPVARPGDSMPGGGHFVTANFFDATYGLNQQGDVSFAGILDTDVNSDTIPDTGLYVFSKGSVRLVAKTGTVIPGIGTIASLGNTIPGGLINDRGQVFFAATLSDGRGVLLLATPQ